MKFFATALSLIALTSTASAKFALKTVSDKAEFDGLCVNSYHTGAGTADLTLDRCNANAAKLFDFKNERLGWSGFGKDAPAGVQISNWIATYDSWGPATIELGSGSKGLAYDAQKGFTQKNLGGLGFIVCPWAHGAAPQLFSLSVKDTEIPSSCAHVKLVKG